MALRRGILLTGLLIFGIGLLLNPLYVSPGNLDGTASEVTYEIDEVESEDEARQVLLQSETTLLCGAGIERPCALEREIAEHGAVEVTGVLNERRASRYSPYRQQGERYSLVELDGDFYVPEAVQSGNTTDLTHRSVSTMEALEHAAVPSSSTSAEVRTAVESGSIRLTERRIPEFERRVPIEHEGNIYYVDAVRYDNTPDEQLIFVRLSLFALGAVVVGTAWVRRRA